MNIFSFLWSYPYIRWHVYFIFIPSFAMWIFNWKYFLRYKKTFAFITLFIFLFGLPTDIIASVILHLWYYNPLQHFGPFMLGLPLGEYAFLLFFPQEFVALLLLLRRRLK